MVNTSYDTIYSLFMDISKTDDFNLPQTDDGRYALINAGRLIFNNKLFSNLQQYDIMEEFNKELNGNQMLLLANCMKLVCFNNLWGDFVSTYSMFQKEIGFKDYSSQLRGRESYAVRQEQVVNALVFSLMEDYEGNEG